MLIKIQTKSQLGLLCHLPIEVVAEAERVISILDENYNNNNVDGGYVLIAESVDDLETIINGFFDYREIPFEFANRINCSSSDDYVSILYLLGTAYSTTSLYRICANLTKSNQALVELTCKYFSTLLNICQDSDK